ncbi:WD40 repeat-like protein [Violaceomyces palustris]|uniref:WD40 repeat-like protein n=1 Tax=Violaceomyces palustris TaxID=1673888 RepID=A0ACD0NT35_9BASI|nr:WD40 repeat-like protein [Violaceomyces palustris]
MPPQVSAPSEADSPLLPSLESLIARSSKRTRSLFSLPPPPHSNSVASLHFNPTDPSTSEPIKSHLRSKISSEYADARTLPPAILAQQAGPGPAKPSTSNSNPSSQHSRKRPHDSLLSGLIDEIDGTKKAANGSSTTTTTTTTTPSHSSTALTLRQPAPSSYSNVSNQAGGGSTGLLSSALIHKKEMASRAAKPTFHPQWKLSRVISGHLGWVRSVAVEPGNKWFATGAGDRMIKIWDLASGELKLSLTGHISTVRGLAISPRHPYLFSCGEDKQVKCWDLEQNKVIRSYSGHLSGIYSLSLHPTLDVLVTAGRDASARVWDMRTKAQIHVLTGHRATIASVVTQDSDPQVITGSMDATVKLWDLAAGKCVTTLTHHKKSVRALAIHPREFTFASGSTGGRNIKTWKCPEGILVNNASHDTIVNTLSVNADGVLFSGGDNGSLKFFDYGTGTPFQSAEDIPQPGSLDAEAGVFCSAFDQTGTRLITGGADKTVKVYKEM